MKRRANLLWKVRHHRVAGASSVGSFVAPVHRCSAQGAIGQLTGDPTGATTGTAADVTGQGPEESDAAAR